MDNVINKKSRIEYLFHLSILFLFLTFFQGISFSQNKFPSNPLYNEIDAYQGVFEYCLSGGQERIAIRSFRQNGVEYRITVDPKTLDTRIEPFASLRCDADPKRVEALLAGTPYRRAMDVERTNEDLMQNAGLIRSLVPVNGYFLTADLCPSSKPGFNQELFDKLEHATQVHGKGALPVALSLSGSWLQKHAESFEWLNKQVAEGRLQITWINHTNHHPYDSHLDISHNFMRESNLDVLSEILDVEKLLIARGIAPSVFFRFPGLVSSPELIEQLERLHLITLGSNAWLAKNQQPKLGSVILIHANLNEPLGVKLMLEWVAEQKPGSITFLPLSNLVRTTHTP
ncbi:MAG: hypothetical protein RL000_921 [Bacteroidota bacterium]|jgi:hypothetical protein